MSTMLTNESKARNVDYTPLNPVKRDGAAEACIWFDIGELQSVSTRPELRMPKTTACIGEQVVERSLN